LRSSDLEIKITLIGRIVPMFGFLVQPVPVEMRLEMVIGMQNEILDGHHMSFFKCFFEKRPEL